MPSRRASAGLAIRESCPARVTVPASGCSTPARILTRVDLPAPFSPTMATHSRTAIERSTPRKATVPPNRLAMLRASSGRMLTIALPYAHRALDLEAPKDRLERLREARNTRDQRQIEHLDHGWNWESGIGHGERVTMTERSDDGGKPAVEQSTVAFHQMPSAPRTY